MVFVSKIIQKSPFLASELSITSQCPYISQKNTCSLMVFMNHIQHNITYNCTTKYGVVQWWNIGFSEMKCQDG